MAGIVTLPVKVGLAFGAFSSNVVCRSLELNVMAGVVTVPVQVGFAFGALSDKVDTMFVPATVSDPETYHHTRSSF